MSALAVALASPSLHVSAPAAIPASMYRVVQAIVVLDQHADAAISRLESRGQSPKRHQDRPRAAQ